MYKTHLWILRSRYWGEGSREEGIWQIDKWINIKTTSTIFKLCTYNANPWSRTNSKELLDNDAQNLLEFDTLKMATLQLLIASAYL